MDSQESVYNPTVADSFIRDYSERRKLEKVHLISCIVTILVIFVTITCTLLAIAIICGKQQIILEKLFALATTETTTQIPTTTTDRCNEC